jgi:uncharacterized protein YigE (DUF2233 family)
MKVISIVIISSFLLLLVLSCQQNKNIVGEENNLGLASDTINSPLVENDSLKLALTDSLMQDSLTKLSQDSAKYPYLYHFFPNTPYATNVLVYELSLDTVEITLFSNEYKSLNYTNETHPKDYLMLTNAGMFHAGGVPVGLFISDCDVVTDLNQDVDRGNFFLLPNGVFYVKDENTAGVLETQLFYDSLYKRETEFKIATQSGPMLVINGEHHPKFNQGSTSKYIRSGVGVTADQKIIFIISEEVVNLYTFASIFLEMKCPNALYLDGAISSMYIQEKGDEISNFRTSYGPVIGVYKNSPDSLIINVVPEPDTTLVTNPINN